MELFLRTANVVAQKKLDVRDDGIDQGDAFGWKTDSRRAVSTHRHLQTRFSRRRGNRREEFQRFVQIQHCSVSPRQDDGINNIPMSVERELDGKIGSMTWWLDNIWMTEAERRDRGIKPPASQFWVDELNTVRVFDQLIYNTDRNQGNLLITPDWKVWMIDHTRAFRTMVALQKRTRFRRIDHKVLRALRKLNTLPIEEELGGYLRPEEISAILGRRDLIVAHFDREIKQNGEDAVYDRTTEENAGGRLP